MLTRNRFLLILVGALLIALVLLANGLDSLALAPAQPFNFNRVEDWETLSATEIIPLLVFSLVIYVFMAALLFPRRIWRHWPAIARTMGLIALFALVIMWLSAVLPGMELPETETMLEGEEEETAAEEPFPPALPPVELRTVPERPLWVTWLASGVLALLVVGMAFWLGRYFWPTPAPPATVLHELAREAQAALDDLEAGEDFHDVIIRCYMEMGRVLAETREIERPQGMTPHEFEEQLLALGLPSAPVSQLTRLFEATRYGRQMADPAQQQTAVASLQAITEASQQVS